MATVQVDSVAVRIELAWWERLFAGGRTRIVVPIERVLAADRVERPTRHSVTPGARAGMVVTGVLKVGRWGLGSRTKRFVSVRRWVPAVRLGLDSSAAAELGYDELVVSTRDATRVVAALARP
ncbi:hypothetical protein [Amycolatopsis nigrescens]|uniref:hypothetical protein n=1 Tax=Amycolatopsis nigrescens TaxID=381445 RepID=UPI00036A63F2|nr:hypothetical protein [Amycolatopsis nigrescens]